MYIKALCKFLSILQSWYCVLSCFSHVQLFATLWIVARQASLSTGFSRQEYWRGLPCPPPGESSPPRNQTLVSSISSTARWVLYHRRHLGNPQHDIRSYGFAHFPSIISLFHEVGYSKYFKYYSLRNPYRPSDFKWSYKTKQLFWNQYNSGDRILMP